MTVNLRGKSVWLTGAGSGIGAALAQELARRGAKLALTARTARALETVAQEVRARGGHAVVFPGDVTNLDEMQRLVPKIEEALVGLDMLVANAGNYVESRPERFDSAEYLALMNVNYGGMLHCMQAVLPGMLARASGTIVGMASLAGYRGLPRGAAYGASKAAMIHFLESARFHLRAGKIKVVIVNPGFVKTRLTDKNDFHMPFLLNPERAACYICDGLESGRDKITFPAPFSWLLELGRIMPFGVYDFLVERQWRRMKNR
jgi:short-subunit dehydrogenase